MLRITTAKGRRRRGGKPKGGIEIPSSAFGCGKKPLLLGLMARTNCKVEKPGLVYEPVYVQGGEGVAVKPAIFLKDNKAAFFL
mmetsp:Transcript_28219/g.51265  ORF Transcript_28219/g.51265 Transcript_28219/m.51265 type:complete len:83 (-) Transcript_28219:30-278(-)